MDDTSEPTKAKTELTLLREEVFPGLKYRKSYLKIAGKKLIHEGREATIEYLRGKDEEEPPNFQPPAKASVVAQSRPFDQWPVFQASQAIQEYIYGLTEAECAASKELLLEGKDSPSKESRDRWFKATGVNNFGYTSAQGLNRIFSAAFNVYYGVIKKVENRNKKRISKLSKAAQERVKDGLEVRGFKPAVAFKEDGHFVYPPSFNPTIYGYQDVAPVLFDPDNPEDIVLPDDYKGYTRSLDGLIGPGLNRLDIPKGSPGYVPEHHRDTLKKGGRVRLKHISAKQKALASILAVFRIGTDWVLVDLRGLLRNAYMREVAKPNELTPKSLLDHFTGDAVLNTKVGELTFCYKLESPAAIHARKPIKGKYTRELLLKKTEGGQSAILVTIDLGQRNPAAIQVSRIVRDANGDLSKDSIEPISRFFLPAHYLDRIQRYRRSYDAFRQQIYDAAFTSLTPEQQEQVVYHETFTPETAKANVLRLFYNNEVTADELPWDKMTSNTRYLSNLYLQRGGDPSLVFFTPPPRKPRKNADPPKKPPKPRKPVQRTDENVSKMRDVRIQLPTETNDAFEKAKSDLYRGHEDYHKLAKHINQLCKEVMNWIDAEAKKHARVDEVIIGVEDLNIPEFHGNGKFKETWNGFFTQKQENRWIINHLHKAATDRAHDKGALIFELAPFNTSIRCPYCGFTDKHNRHGDDFTCLHCGRTFHADLEVATGNLALVSVLGRALPGAVREKSSDAKKTRTARNEKNDEAPSSQTSLRGDQEDPMKDVA